MTDTFTTQPNGLIIENVPAIAPSPPGTPEHLGGHYNTTCMDTHTLHWLVRKYDIKSMLDVGCGPGGMVDYARTIGLDAWGIDGDPSVAREGVIFTHDYITGPLTWKPVDLIWCVEFVEHVHPEFIPNFLATFDAGRVLLLTHAVPGQGGHHHINLQSWPYWVARLGDKWRLDGEATELIRHTSRCIPYISSSVMIWIRR